MPLGKLRLEKSGLCSIDLDLLENKDKFTGPHGELLGKVHSFLTTASFKAIRGPDKQNLTKLQDTFRIAVRVALNGFLQVNMVPYLVQFTEACKQRSVFTEAILQEDMCFMKLPHMVFKPESVIETFKDFGGFMKELGLAAASVAHGADRMNAEVAQQWMQKWQTKCAAFLKAVRVFDGVPDGAAGDAVAEAALSTRMIFGLHLFHLFGFLSLVLRCLINGNKHATGYSFALVAAFNFVVWQTWIMIIIYNYNYNYNYLIWLYNYIWHLWLYDFMTLYDMIWYDIWYDMTDMMIWDDMIIFWTFWTLNFGWSDHAWSVVT